jgi:Rod binding domain-containing protein
MTDPVARVIPLPDTSVPRDPKVWEAAKKFEAMTIGQMLAPMFDTDDISHSLMGGGDAEAAWRPMMIDAIGKQMEGRGGFGLAQPVYDAMLRAQEGGAQERGVQAAAAGRSAPRATAAQPRKPK